MKNYLYYILSALVFTFFFAIFSYKLTNDIKISIIISQTITTIIIGYAFTHSEDKSNKDSDNISKDINRK